MTMIDRNTDERRRRETMRLAEVIAPPVTS
jgi:hypothetical protein